MPKHLERGIIGLYFYVVQLYDYSGWRLVNLRITVRNTSTDRYKENYIEYLFHVIADLSFGFKQMTVICYFMITKLP
jgi:hypothetical protein